MEQRSSASNPDIRPGEKATETFAREVSSRVIVIEGVRPQIDGGRFPVKREVGNLLEVSATIFKEGHDRISAALLHRRDNEADWHATPMTCVNPGLDLWTASFGLEQNIRYFYTIEAWQDVYTSWCEEVEKKRGAGQDVPLELAEGRHLVADAAERADDADRSRFDALLSRLDASSDPDESIALLASEETAELMARWPDRRICSRYSLELEVVVDRERARFGAWYEMFPRSQGQDPTRSTTLDDCIQRLPELRALGFDVIYLPPIHPIGRVHRKGRNNSLVATPEDPGSPYAIGSSEGGHDAIHPDLGTLDDFRRLVTSAKSYDMEIALDFAIQCAPDHPWVTEHPEWFVFRPDGTIKYAENPPKKYEDIVTVDFYCAQREELWAALRDVVLFWIEHGVKIFRVDNPHTKPVPFWEWLIGDVQKRYPDVIFLSEAFTRPPMLKYLAKAGFTQSYTYFTWRNFKGELEDYLTELTRGEEREYLRPNFFTNTPDILPPFLQEGGRPAFQIRFVLAATLSSTYGIYSGFELCENEAIPGREEYANSEKYQYKVRDWDRPGNIKALIAAVNRIRRENPALQELHNLAFHPAHDDNVLFYSKMTAERDNLIFIAINLDPFEPHEAEIELPLEEMNLPDAEAFEIENLLSGEKHLWRGTRQRIRLDPAHDPAVIFRVTPWEHVPFRDPHAA